MDPIRNNNHNSKIMEKGLHNWKFGLHSLKNVYLNKLKILPFQSFTQILHHIY